jgi:deoxyribodipyrimidine photo-lyase
MSKTPCTLVWLRRDLRLNDHAALACAFEFDEPVQLAFVFDTTILHALPGWKHGAVLDDRRVAFIHAAISQIQGRIAAHKKSLITGYGDPSVLIPEFANALGAARVVFAHDDEPAALARDEAVRTALGRHGIGAVSVKDQCIFERSEVLTGAGKPFSVFTPYKNAWLKKLSAAQTSERATGAGHTAPGQPVHKRFADRLLDAAAIPSALPTTIPSLAAMGFAPGNLHEMKIPLGECGARELFEAFKPRIGQYRQARDYPGIKGPSYLSVHLRFGTISVRELVRYALKQRSLGPQHSEGADTWLSELIWRDFYMQILHHHPHVVSRSFRPEYDRIQWHEGHEADCWFTAWCQGQTGYPIVDAGMRQLNATGYMHNRLRMVVASFLTKDLGIHWRRGEDYFACKLNDFDLSANNGGWQWAASTGCDAQPYFRIFNPVSQSERFDEKGSFIRRYVPEIARLPDTFIHAPWTAPPLVLQEAGIVMGATYPHPIVDHNQARQKTLMRFSVLRHREPEGRGDHHVSPSGPARDDGF